MNKFNDYKNKRPLSSQTIPCKLVLFGITEVSLDSL